MLLDPPTRNETYELVPSFIVLISSEGSGNDTTESWAVDIHCLCASLSIHTCTHIVAILYHLFFYQARVPLNGDKEGKVQTFTSSLPGLPDNISPSSSGGYWVGIAASRNQGRLDRFYNSRHLRSLMAKVKLSKFVC